MMATEHIAEEPEPERARSMVPQEYLQNKSGMLWHGVRQVSIWIIPSRGGQKGRGKSKQQLWVDLWLHGDEEIQDLIVEELQISAYRVDNIDILPNQEGGIFVVFKPPASALYDVDYFRLTIAGPESHAKGK